MSLKTVFKRVVTRPFAVAAFTLFAAPALAATAQVTADLNMRAGPGTRYPAITTVPRGHAVTVYGCLQGYAWCDVSWRNARGWVSANYLNYRHANSWRPIHSWGPTIGLPLITFSFGDYSYRHYRNYDWYRHRDRWRIPGIGAATTVAGTATGGATDAGIVIAEATAATGSRGRDARPFRV